jgi:ubiquinone/menaquinone biosynthesis C-methylase UbiE
MVRLVELARYKGCPIPEGDPLRFYYYPVLGHFYRKRIDVALGLLGQGQRVLEVGYGSGTSFLELSALFKEIHGLDTHDYGPAIEGIFAREGVSVHLTRGSFLDPPYAAQQFDALLAISILEHLRPSDLPLVMEQAGRLLRQGGVFVVGMPGLNRTMSAAFWILGCDISKHHFSRPSQALEAAAKVFVINRIIRQPRFARDSFLGYMWFRARKP